jgi:hypothetical protein
MPIHRQRNRRSKLSVRWQALGNLGSPTRFWSTENRELSPVRVLASRKLGIAEIPTIELAYLSEAQRKAYVLADNKLAENAGWDTEMLGLELRDLKELGFNLELTGFDELELQSLLAEKTEGLTDPDDVPEVPEQPVTQMGDFVVARSASAAVRRLDECRDH